MIELSFFQENKDVMIGGSFALFGVFLGWALNLAQSYFQSKREDRLYHRKKREEIYADAVSQIENICASLSFERKEKLTEQDKEALNATRCVMQIFAREDVYFCYNDILEKLAGGKTPSHKRIHKLIAHVRDDLGLKN